MSKTYDMYDIEDHKDDLFSKHLSIKYIAIGLAISALGLIIFWLGPNMHTRSGRWFILVSVAMVLGGAVLAFIMRHTYRYKSTGETMDLWFRYFESDQTEPLIQIFNTENWAELANLRFALDDDENDNTDASGNSSLSIQADGVPSGDFVAVQVIEHIDRAPEGITPVKIFRGKQAAKYLALLPPLIKALD